jgi:hypothetical protein
MFRTLALAMFFGALAPTPSPSFDELRGFSTVVVNHINAVLGTENLPVAVGVPVEPGILVTLAPDRMQVFDRDVVALQGGALTDTTVAAECRSQCPAAFFDAFQQTWVEHAVEASTFSVEIPTRVLFAAHHQTPARTLVQAAYAAAETRPVSPPAMFVVVNSARAGLRAEPFFLLPPTGLEMRPGSAALGLTVRVGPGDYVVTAADSRYARENRATDLKALAAIARDNKRRYPGKEVVILEPQGAVTVGELMSVVATLDSTFPTVVLSAGQVVQIP